MPIVTEEQARKQRSRLLPLVALVALLPLTALLLPAFHPVWFVTGNARWAIGAFYSRKPSSAPQGFSYSPNTGYGEQVWTLRLADGYYVITREDPAMSTNWMS